MVGKFGRKSSIDYLVEFSLTERLHPPVDEVLLVKVCLLDVGPGIYQQLADLEVTLTHTEQQGCESLLLTHVDIGHKRPKNGTS